MVFHRGHLFTAALAFILFIGSIVCVVNIYASDNGWQKNNRTVKMDSKYTMTSYSWIDYEYEEYKGRLIIRAMNGKIQLDEEWDTDGVNAGEILTVYKGKWNGKYYFQKRGNAIGRSLYVWTPGADYLRKVKNFRGYEVSEFKVTDKRDVFSGGRIRQYATVKNPGEDWSQGSNLYLINLNSHKTKWISSRVHAVKKYNNRFYYVQFNKNRTKATVYRINPNGTKKRAVKSVKLKKMQYIEAMTSKSFKVVYGNMKTRTVRYR